MDQISSKPYRKIVIVIINLLTAGLQFVIGADYRGPFPQFVNGYLIDILLPFSVYFLLCLPASDLLKPWYVKAALVLMFGFSIETAQYLGYPILGSTFDPFDFAAYTMGILLAVVFDQIVFPRLFIFWKVNSTDGQ